MKAFIIWLKSLIKIHVYIVGAVDDQRGKVKDVKVFFTYAKAEQHRQNMLTDGWPFWKIFITSRHIEI